MSVAPSESGRNRIMIYGPKSRSGKFLSLMNRMRFLVGRLIGRIVRIEQDAYTREAGHREFEKIKLLAVKSS
jgi:hypothetical protein